MITPTTTPFLANAVNEAARERVWRARSNRGGRANLELLDRAVALRHELASLYGYPDYPTFVLRRRMAEAPAAVFDFLSKVRDTVLAQETVELDELRLDKAMLLGKPVVATGYSGNLDFMDADTALLVDYRPVALREPFPPFPRGATWAEPSAEHAAAQMRWVFDHPEAAWALGERARRRASEVLSLDAAGRRMRRRLEEIRESRRKGPTT